MPFNREVHLPSLVQLLASGLAILVFFTVSTGLFLAGAAAVGVSRLAGTDALPFFSLGWGAAAICLLLLPSLLHSFNRLKGRESRLLQALDRPQTANVLMLLWLPLVALGEVVSRLQNLNWLLLPPIQVLAVGIPLWWLIELGRQGLGSRRPQREWGVIGIGVAVTPVVVLLIEIILVGILAAILFVWVAAQPDLLETFNRISQRLVNAQFDPETSLRILRPHLRNPALLYLAALFAAGIVPLVEELLKPLALWGVNKRSLTPAEGFVIGLLCGGAFAFVESLGMLATPVANAWAVVVIGRLGTGLLHIVTAGLVGWGLASAWCGGRYLRLGLIFFIALSAHGMWNFFGMLAGLIPLAVIQQPLEPFDRLGAISGLALITLGFMLFLLLIGGNNRLRQRVLVVDPLTITMNEPSPTDGEKLP
ncbi:MAG: PrsW family glutamic-type intramembrane protease [Anaerolineaceae bacterium]|nr:PrsW family glutamic-type intramembrane protease [Anaerolineaceae bacterium]